MFSLFQRTMILKFPNAASLRTILANSVSDPFRNAAVRAGRDVEGSLYVEFAGKLNNKSLNELRQHGVHKVNASPVAFDVQADCWLQLVALDAQKDGLAVPEQAVVLFDLPNGQLLAQMAIEVLRLGNDRQSFRWLGELPSDDNPTNGARALLRVVGPPYYTLLRALSPRDRTTAPQAYLERAPRVWVELGHEHPLAAKIKPPANQILLLSAPNRWEYLPDANFRDVYDVLDFNLPEGRVGWTDKELKDRLRVSMKLTRAGGFDTPEMWVLRDDPIEQLNAFVQNSEEQLLQRLAFAVGEKDGQTTIVLRVRPSKLAPPVLVLRAESFTPYRKMPNLYLPCGRQLHPPLRRDVVRKKLADDPAQLTWLYPGDNGSFVPETMSDVAFRPLTDWVDYIIDREHQSLEAWIQATRFEFESFTCDEDTNKPKKPPADGERTKRQRQDKRGPRDESAEILMLKPADTVDNADEPMLEVLTFAKQEPSQLQIQLADLENRFLAGEGDLDTPERQQIWPEMARVNAALNNTEDAGLCYVNALWNNYDNDSRLLREWFTIEAQSVVARPNHGGTKELLWTASALGARNGHVSAHDLDLLLEQDKPSGADVRALAAYLVLAAQQTTVPAALATRLSEVQRFLETYERQLPVRTAWLAWSGLTQMTNGDVLALARARDRLLERLYQQGLRPDIDLPGFLRSAGVPGGQRFRGLRKWMSELCVQAHRWAKEIASKPTAGHSDKGFKPYALPEGTGSRATHAYIDLLFAFGLARLGEMDASRELSTKAEQLLNELQDDVHRVLLQAFLYRLEQVRSSTPPRGPWPPALLEQLNQLPTERRFRVDRMRGKLRILEPDQKVDAYNAWYAWLNEIEKKLAELVKQPDRQAIATGFVAMLGELGKKRATETIRGRVLRAALQEAPLIGEEFALDMLHRLGPIYDAMEATTEATSLPEQAKLLERALFVAAHFDRAEVVESLVGRFQRMLQNPGMRSLETLDQVTAQCFVGLRKLGMRNEIDLLLRQLTDLILEGKDIAEFNINPDNNRPKVEAMGALLHVATGWFYFGREEQAEPVLNLARNILFKGDLVSVFQTQVACAYVQTIGHAPAIEAAQRGLEEVFERLGNIWDNFLTHSHFSLSQLALVEAVVTAIVSDDHTMGADARRWLDEDEFLVRRRIHRDLRNSMTHER